MIFKFVLWLIQISLTQKTPTFYFLVVKISMFMWYSHSIYYISGKSNTKMAFRFCWSNCDILGPRDLWINRFCRAWGLPIFKSFLSKLMAQFSFGLQFLIYKTHLDYWQIASIYTIILTLYFTILGDGLIISSLDRFFSL